MILLCLQLKVVALGLFPLLWLHSKAPTFSYTALLLISIPISGLLMGLYGMFYNSIANPLLYDRILALQPFFCLFAWLALSGYAKTIISKK